MGRQTFHEGPYIDPQVANGGNLTATTIEDMWAGITFTPIFANDAKAGKIYSVRAGGTLTTGAGAQTMIITPQWGPAGTTLGASGAQTMTASITTGPWSLFFDLVFRTIGAAGANSTSIGTGFFNFSGTLATVSTAICIPFGGVSASVDSTINGNLTFRKTLTVAGTMITQYCYIFPRN
jgi:hypothetical protein